MDTTLRTPAKLFAIFAAAFLTACTAVLFAAPNAHAIYSQNELSMLKSGTHYVMLDPAKDKLANIWSCYDGSYKGKPTNLKSSNSSVAKVIKTSKTSFDVKFKKAGKATVTYKFKGKKYTHRFVVVKYKCPAKKLKIGTTGYKAAFKKTNEIKLSEPVVGQKLIAKAKKGWKAESINIVTKTSEKIKKSGYVIKKADKHITVFWKHKKKGMMVCSTFKLK